MKTGLLAGVSCLLLLGACATTTTDAPLAETNATSQTAAPAKKKEETGLSNIQKVVTEDGVSAWLVSEHSIPIVALEMAWKSGEVNDPAGKEGASQLMVYMMNEGAGDLDSKAYATRMEELNMTFGCSTGKDWTSCSMYTLSENFEDAMDMVRLGLSETRFDEAPFARAVEETQIAVKRSETQLGTIAARALMEELYPEAHPYTRYETADSVNAVTIEDAIARRDAIMTKDKMVVTAVGDITPEQLKTVMEDTFSVLPETGETTDVADVMFKPALEKPILKELEQPQTLVVFSAPGLMRDDPDFFAAYVTNYILGGGGFSARLMDEIREKQGLTYGIYTSLSTMEHLGSWAGSAQTMNEKAGELIARTKVELYKMATEGPTQKELDDAKAYITGAYPLSFDTNTKIASQMMGIRQFDLGMDYIATRNDKINEVTLEDVKRVAASYLKPENFTFVTVGQPVGMSQIDGMVEAYLAGEDYEPIPLDSNENEID